MKMTEMMMIHYQRNHLIEKDANTDEKDEYQLTTLHYACGSGNLPMKRVLILKQNKKINVLLFILHVKMAIFKLFNISMKQKIKISILLFNVLQILVIMML